ncbi:MAG: HAMP domain-containing histidine kinase [Campylobacter sp.]|nr:HAMP domain-containing histidine kinase [Campylobacter sp.]
MLNKKTLPIFLLYTITTTIFILSFAIIYYADMYREIERVEYRNIMYIAREIEHEIKDEDFNDIEFKEEWGVLAILIDKNSGKILKKEFDINELDGAKAVNAPRGKLRANWFRQQDYIYLKAQIYIKHSSQNYTLILKSVKFKNSKNEILIKISLICIFCLILVLLVGYFIIYLSLKPVFNQINELNLFIKDTTHEIKTPLSIILMSVEVFENNPQKYLTNIKNATKNISNIYDDLVELNLQSSPLKLENLDISNELNMIISQFDPIAKSKNLTLKSQIQPTEILTDKSRIDKIFYNLLSNAIKYSFENSEIYINLNSEFFSIRNQSQTISPENLGKIYEKFKRFDKTKGGFGIGLSLVKKYCDDLGYEVACQSQNEMTEFKVGFKFKK